MDEAAELCRGGFLGLEQRRAGEADVAGVREHLAHLGVGAAVLAAVAFVHQHKDVYILHRLAQLGDGLELVDHGRDDVGLALAQQLRQVIARLGLFDLFAARLEGAPDLRVEVDRGR